jgi:hypothetical protein
MPNVMESAFSHPGYQHFRRAQEGAGQHQYALPVIPSPKESDRDRSHLSYLRFRCVREGAEQPRNVLAMPSAMELGGSPPGCPYQRHVQGGAQQLYNVPFSMPNVTDFHVPIIRIGVELEKRPNNFEMSSLRRPMQRSPSSRVSCIHLCATLKKELGNLKASFSRRQMQRGLFAVATPGIRICAVLEKDLRNLWMSFF